MMIMEMINKTCEVIVAFSKQAGVGIIPMIYKGLLLDVDENYIKFKIEHKRSESETIIINNKYLVSIKRIYE